MAKGLATVVRYRQDDDNRSGRYDELLMAEAKAIKAKKGVHAMVGGALGDKVPVVRVQELTGVNDNGGGGGRRRKTIAQDDER